MLDCVAGCAVVELRLRSRCVDKAEMHFLQPFNNERMLLRPSAVSKYAKKLIVTPLTIPSRTSASCWQVDKCSLGSCILSLRRARGGNLTRVTSDIVRPKEKVTDLMLVRLG